MSQHHFCIEHAKLYGIHEAILINNFIYWIKKNKAEGRNRFDDKVWTYMPMSGFQEVFEYLSKKQIRTTISKLIDLGIIVTGNYNTNPHDRTLWYAFVDECIFLGGQMDVPQRANGKDPEGKCITNNNTDNNTDDTSSPSQAQEDTAPKFVKDLVVTEKSSDQDKIIKRFHSFFCKHRTKPDQPFKHKVLLGAQVAAWKKDLDLLMRVDSRTKDELFEVYTFIKNSKDPFWRDTILSLGGVRKHFDQIWDKKEAEKEKVDKKAKETKDSTTRTFPGEFKK